MRSMVFCAAMLLVAACSGEVEKPKRPPALVEVEAVSSQTFAEVIEAVGSAIANEQVVLSSPVTERIVSLNYSDGGLVRRGEVIARLAQSQEVAELAGAQARAQEATQQLERIKQLRQRGFATGASLDTQIAAANAAKASAEQVKAAISDRVIRAPFSGYLGLRTVSPGAIVAAGTPIATVSDISRIKLDFNVPETQLAALSKGQALLITAAAYPGRVFNGTVATIDPVVDPTTRAVAVRALLPNTDHALKPGMLLTVKVLARQHQGLSVPELAVVGEASEQYVFVAEGGKVKRVLVDTGARQDGRVEILKGLNAGQKIVTEGVVKLADGAPIRMANEKGNGAAAGSAPQPTAASLAANVR
ncbi:MAG: efflux RND transporter periplasmic adaptor subunit [Sphingobium sp.]|nr:efflux RND transporter periplasmic adaptor subunit [Sphingobium sp.]MDX3908486.1 efflux RND transporter periplasmic adaptor subunit [Sphingobium sp.]